MAVVAYIILEEEIDREIGIIVVRRVGLEDIETKDVIDIRILNLVISIIKGDYIENNRGVIGIVNETEEDCNSILHF